MAPVMLLPDTLQLPSKRTAPATYCPKPLLGPAPLTSMPYHPERLPPPMHAALPNTDTSNSITATHDARTVIFFKGISPGLVMLNLRLNFLGEIAPVTKGDGPKIQHKVPKSRPGAVKVARSS